MSNAKFGGHYIKEWRLHRGLSLRKLAARMEAAPGEELISFASLSRIENGQQPYSEPILEALADALDTKPEHLISRTPGPDAEVIDLFDTLDTDKQNQVLAVLKAIGMAVGL